MVVAPVDWRASAKGAALLLVLALSFAGLSGCGGISTRSYLDAVLGRASSELHCPRAELYVREVGGHGWVAEGCGRRQTFTCAEVSAGSTSSRREVLCAPDAAPTTTMTAAAAPDASVPASSTMLEDAETALAALASCPASPVSRTVAFVVTPEGRFESLDAPGLSGELTACIVGALRGARFATRGRREAARILLTAAPPTSGSSVTAS